ncbi:MULTISPECIES: MDR family MFS transporter [Peribacillus]|jgi:EmrB/QacA subfamily drug resistance transporter|uniref:MFS transporter n=1 Tax=Peribacillus butanolivorans TaxID=421767 RepID=A0AAX0RZ74_9BACI|nr:MULTISPECIES: MDR family MFS transporter [Peribacillus]AXN39220.1 MFS transporter [Peribacillus butanolivorans]KON67340.1 major facilitator transporter [Peribacillus butanolivorans]MBK5444492.1 MFS transporter [Peribacillus sp. TH24]MBK5460803.1 MFS transporter [Peribacillus sp. TH27]MBK5485881.1 MFS transporter [Peribacillus sp. TH16]
MKEQKNQKFIVAGLLLGILMSAMDNTIVATAMGTIVSDLGGFDKFVWVTSAYMVATMASMPIFGKLSDMYGRKRFFIFGLVVFLIGSALCGMAQSIVQLSIFRAIQGIGGGALMPIAFTIIFDIFPPEKRGKLTGLFGAVFGASSVLGPLLGAYITEYSSWNWIFYVNVPIGIISLFFIMRYYKESANTQEQKIDWGGAATLVIAVISLMFALELGGEYGWDSFPIIGLFASFLVFFISFFFFEKRAKDPIISLWLFKRRLFATSQILAILYGGTFIILTVYIPIFVQAVYGGSATNAGLILTPMMLGSVVGSAIGGIFNTKTSFRNLMTISVVCYFAGMLLLGTITPDTSRTLLTLYMILTGFGMGFSFSLLPIASIHNLEPRFRGSANSTNSFLRSFGMTLGVTIYGAIQNNVFTSKMTDAFKGMQGGPDTSVLMEDPRQLFQSDARAQIPDFILDKIVHAMSDSISLIFTLALIPIGLAAITVFFMGKTRVETPPKEESLQ